MELNNRNPPPYSDYPPNQSHQMGDNVIVTPPTVVVNTPVVVPVVMGQYMGHKPTPHMCVSCGCQIVTRVDTKPVLRAHIWAIVLCLIGFWPCMCVPYCMDSCKSADHYCPNCNAYIGSYV